MLSTMTPAEAADRAYRRGAHQATAVLYDLARQQPTRAGMLAVLGRAEDFLCHAREDQEEHPFLLDELRAHLAGGGGR